jgi:hypothetical protein
VPHNKSKIIISLILIFTVKRFCKKMEPDFPVIQSDCQFVLNVIFVCLNDTFVGFIGYFWIAVLFCLW